MRSFTAHDIYKLNGQVPETVVSGETADISPLAQFKWYEWVLFRDTSVTYPDTPMVLDRDLGPAIDIGPAMTRKILNTDYRRDGRRNHDPELQRFHGHSQRDVG